MLANFPDTIVALSSGRLPSGVAVIRVSGAQTRFVLETFVGKVTAPRVATYARIRNSSGEPIDAGLVLFFPAPNSFTGEDSAELQIHGGKAVVAAMIEALTSLPDVRQAEAGEFTRRAFLNGKLDLLGTEALADLISAETEAQRRLAVLNADGAQSELYDGWRTRLIHARAMIEAELDFADESDVPGSVADAIWSDMKSLKGEIETHIGAYRCAEIIRDGYDVVIVGPPNAGKSSLLNALARREAAIVSDEPGTTRDLVELALDIDGVKVRITDTAGLREGAGKVEAMGIERAIRRAEAADLVLVLADSAGPREALPIDNGNILHLSGKADLFPDMPVDEVNGLSISSVSGRGIPELLEEIGRRAVEAVGNYGDILPSRLRHVELLQDAVAHLDQATSSESEGLELRAEDLRLAGERLGRISGVVDVEDLLDVIFSQFCIGK